MKTAQQGRGFIPLLLLIVVAVVVVGLIAMQLNKNKTAGYSSSSTSQSSNSSTASTAPQTGDVMVTVDPATVDTTAGQTFTVDVKIDTGPETVSAAELHLSYDSSVLEATEIKNGTFLPVVLTPGKLETGAASLVVGSNPTDPKKGSATLATVTFKAKKAGSSMISVASTTKVAAIGKGSTNMLGSTTGATVTIK